MSELLHFILDHEEPFKSKSRLSSLYSDFSSLRTTNPDGYRANVSAWQSALSHACRAGLTPGSGALSIQTGHRLASELETKGWGRPLALDAVMEDAVTSKSMMPLQDFLDVRTSIYEKRWMKLQIPTPLQVAKWGLRQVGLGGGNQLTAGEFVVLANVEAAAKQVMVLHSKIASSPTSLVYSLDTFTKTFSQALSSSHPLTATDVRILLTHLTRDKALAAISTSSTGTINAIKFASPTSNTPIQPVTSHDETIATLHTLNLSLTTQIAELSSRIASLAIAARTAVSTTDRPAALRALRAKKSLEATLTKRSDSLVQVEAVLMSIDEAAGQVDMVHAMEASSRVLRDLNKQVGGVERVENVMEGLKDQMEAVEDVGRVLVEGGNETIDEGEIDLEMELLEREETEKRAEVERIKEQKRLEVERIKEAKRVEAERIEEEKRVEIERRKLEDLPKVPSGLKSEVDDGKTPEMQNGKQDVEKRSSPMSLDESNQPATTKEHDESVEGRQVAS